MLLKFKCYIYYKLFREVTGESKTSMKRCEQCPTNQVAADASWRCLDCRANICDNCKDMHSRVQVLKGRYIMLTVPKSALVY